MRYARDMRVVETKYDLMDYSAACAMVAEEKRVIRKAHSKGEVRELFVQLGLVRPKKGVCHV